MEDGKRYLKQYDALRLYVGYHKDRDSALVEVTNIEFDLDSQQVVYSLGKIVAKE